MRGSSDRSCRRIDLALKPAPPHPDPLPRSGGEGNRGRRRQATAPCWIASCCARSKSSAISGAAACPSTEAARLEAQQGGLEEFLAQLRDEPEAALHILPRALGQIQSEVAFREQAVEEALLDQLMGFAEAVHGRFHHLEPAAVAVGGIRPAQEESGLMQPHQEALLLRQLLQLVAGSPDLLDIALDAEEIERVAERGGELRRPAPARLLDGEGAKIVGRLGVAQDEQRESEIDQRMAFIAFQPPLQRLKPASASSRWTRAPSNRPVTKLHMPALTMPMAEARSLPCRDP